MQKKNPFTVSGILSVSPAVAVANWVKAFLSYIKHQFPTDPLEIQFWDFILRPWLESLGEMHVFREIEPFPFLEANAQNN